jgi:hypothetical protein
VKDAIIQGPKKKYPVVTGEEFNRVAMSKYYGALKDKLAAREKEDKASSMGVSVVPVAVDV